MKRFCIGLAVGTTVWLNAYAAETKTWTEAKDSRFAVYSQAGAASARSTLVWFEQLRAFFERTGLLEHHATASTGSPVQVIVFDSQQEYDRYRLRPAADAYYVGTETADYIVMPAGGEHQLSVAAHEYAHLVFHRSGLSMPPWLNEGLADYFSSVRMTNGTCEVGGNVAGRSGTLKRGSWIPLEMLIRQTGPFSGERKAVELYYAESWALTSMLVMDDTYSPHFAAFLHLMQGGAAASSLDKVFAEPMVDVESDLRRWVESKGYESTRPCDAARPNVVAEEKPVSPSKSRLLLADLLFAIGDLDLARASFNEAAVDSADPHAFAALGTIALRKGDKAEALRDWQKATDKGLEDAQLSYEWAVLADEAGEDMEAMRAALQRAIRLKPDFDDARYKLALLESNAGNYKAALDELRAMQKISEERAFAYWTAYAYAATELDLRDQAKTAAQRAKEHARNANERTAADQLAYEASTDLTVQFSRTPDGKLQMITSRKSHDSNDWNPFVQAQDHIRREDGKLRSVECGEGRIQGVSVETRAGILSLKIEDPSRVLMSNGPKEFFCGPQASQAVQVEYAASANHPLAGDLRGMRFQ